LTKRLSSDPKRKRETAVFQVDVGRGGHHQRGQLSVWMGEKQDFREKKMWGGRFLNCYFPCIGTREERGGGKQGKGLSYNAIQAPRMPLGKRRESKGRKSTKGTSKNKNLRKEIGGVKRGKENMLTDDSQENRGGC